MTYNMKWRMTFEDFKVLQRAHTMLTQQRRIFQRGLLMLGSLSVVFAVPAFLLDEQILGCVFIGLALGVLIRLSVLTPWYARRSFDQQRLDRDDTKVHADMDGLGINIAETETTMKWSGVYQVDTRPAHTILWLNPVVGVIIPDRAFSTFDEARRFATFAKERAGD